MSIASRSSSRRILLGTVATALITPTMTACGIFSASGENTTLLENIESGHVVVGSTFSNPGISSRDQEGNVDGLDIDVAKYVLNAIADDNGWAHPTVEWRLVPESQRASMLENAYVDMIASTFTMTPERAVDTAFAGPYLLTHQAMLVREDESVVTDLDSLSGNRLCSVTGTTAAGTIQKKLPDVVLEEYDSYEACLNALRNGNVDAVSTDAAILEGFEAQEPDTFEVVPLDLDGSPLSDEHYGLGLRTQDEASVTAVNDALTSMYEDGSFDRFVADNLGTDPAVMRDKPGDTSFLNEPQS